MYNGNRRSGNYKPNIWDDDYVQSQTTIYTGEEFSKRAAELKEGVRKMVEEKMDPLEKLELVDLLQRLGLAQPKIRPWGVSYHFEDEIQHVLEHIYTSCYYNGDQDLYATALQFRLLRQHGYKLPQEVFCGFMDDQGNFKRSLSEDTKGILSLYEATYLCMEGESIMEAAQRFSTKHLREIQNMKVILDQDLVDHALEMPLYWRVQRFEARWFISVYEKRHDMNPVLLEFAKLDYNMVQAKYLEEIKQMSRWNKDIRLAEKMSFARDRLVEGFLWAMGFTPEPQFEYCRKISTKLSVLLTILDDLYDVYGALNELEIFTDVVQRWDVNAAETLPEYMKICFLAIFNSMNELGYDVLKDQGLSIITNIRKQWANLCKFYLLEVKWNLGGHAPSLDEYLDTAFITNTGPLLLMHAYFCITNPINIEDLRHLEQYPGIIRSSAMILRLANDLGTSPDEMLKGDIPKSIQCYMRESGCSEEKAGEYINGLIAETWKKLNGELVTKMERPLPKEFRRTATNLPRIAQFIYQHGDGFGVRPDEMKNRIVALFFEPIPMP
ncbi:PREDICTED: (-)-alpha-terpineol synthase-like [Ipomoea nil]|uniref:(-)-alpha-terpineol synthase-like n=1 Tax=Ipomoea nil TaxID=35883 RepID=UPI0009011E1A|nr:PREDICTED: (-)-alpha-terpineol synthase-like [Ipomoea nil]